MRYTCPNPGDVAASPQRVLVVCRSGTFSAGRSFALPRPLFRADFVGRAGELARLDAMLSSAQSGFGGVVLLVGEAGIGKTRTAEEFAERARGRGVRVVSGRCWEGEPCPAFGPWSMALQALAAEIDAAQLRRLLGEGAEDVAVLLPEIRRSYGELAAPPRLEASDGVQRLFASLSRLLRSAARRAPLAIILDNLHLADDSSLRFLRSLCPELAASRLLVVGTCRAPGEAPREALTLTVEELAKVRSFLRLELTGLDKSEVLELVSRALDTRPEVADRIHERTEGNPLFVLELVRQMAADQRGETAGGPLPDGIRQAIRRRVERLSPACRNALATAAVLGRSFAFETLERTYDGEGRGRVPELVGEAETAAVLQIESPGLRKFRFSHDLVREALLEGMPAVVKSRIHARAALVLEEIEAADGRRLSGEILHHLVESGVLVEPHRLVERTIMAAVEATDRCATDEALRIIDATLTVWEGLGRAVDVRVAPLVHRRGRLLTDLLRPVEARDDLLRAFNLYLEAGDGRAAVEVALTPAMGSADGNVWMGDGGVPGLLEQALSLVPAGSREHASLLLRRGSRADLCTALDFARASGEKHLEAEALGKLAYHELMAWELDASAAWLASAEATGPSGIDHGFGLAYIRFCLGVITGSTDAAARAIHQLDDLARRSRSLPGRTLALGCASFLAIKRGEWEEARRKVREGVALLASSGPVHHLSLIDHVLIQAELQTGHFKAVRARMQSAADRGAWPGPIDHRRTLFGALRSGDTSLLPPIPERVEMPDPDGPLAHFVVMDLLYTGTLAWVRRDRRTAGFCLERLRKWKGMFWDASTDGELGLLCSLLDRHDEAVGHFEDAMAFSRRAGYLPDLASTMSNLADTLVRRDGPGDRERAAGLLDEGLSICQKLGMAPLEKRIRAARQALDGSEGRRRAQPDGLTHREIEVLRLVSRGCTNAEIAERLFVSPLTVARHVHNLLDKTGMANRAEVTAWAGKSGFLDDK